ncbi:MAG TPA: 3-isopropylmalate dehydratase small subunit [Oscillospiraceae bacterium]|nr:3-isopropylmalate dehydratase small subunit [Oscillospiraceae bacterium]
MQGMVWKFGNDVDTDAIIPARYLNTSEASALAQHVMEDADPTFAQKVTPGSIIVALKNFGCGSSREHAPIAIKAAGISCVIAHSFARIFYRNAINIGLPILACPEAAEKIAAGDEIRVDLENGTIYNLTSKETYQAAPFPPFMQNIMAKGGLIGYVQWRLQQQQ